MSPEQYTALRTLKGLALPNHSGTPTTNSCIVEQEAKDVVLRGECRGNELAGCVLCVNAGITCEYINAVINNHDGLAPLNRTITSLRGNGAGLAG